VPEVSLGELHLDERDNTFVACSAGTEQDVDLRPMRRAGRGFRQDVIGIAPLEHRPFDVCDVETEATPDRWERVVAQRGEQVERERLRRADVADHLVRKPGNVKLFVVGCGVGEKSIDRVRPEDTGAQRVSRGVSRCCEVLAEPDGPPAVGMDAGRFGRDGAPS
jgi:hypothetical protein